MQTWDSLVGRKMLNVLAPGIISLEGHSTIRYQQIRPFCASPHIVHLPLVDPRKMTPPQIMTLLYMYEVYNPMWLRSRFCWTQCCLLPSKHAVDCTLCSSSAYWVIISFVEKWSLWEKFLDFPTHIYLIEINCDEVMDLTCRHPGSFLAKLWSLLHGLTSP